MGLSVDMPLDVDSVRADFPAMATAACGERLTYLDSASTAQKPTPVLSAIHDFFTSACGNVDRGVHRLSMAATEAYEGARDRARVFVGAEDRGEIIFTHGTTSGINLLASALGPVLVGADDEVLVTQLEHHSNLVPWQQLCSRRGARLRMLPIDERGDLALDQLDRFIGARTRIVAFTHVANSIGTVVPVQQLIAAARSVGACVVVDGAQAVPHQAIDVRAIGCDFYAFSGHKLYGPTGIGVLYGRRERLLSMPPWQGGGGMIETVRATDSTYRPPPYRFEAGSPNVAGAVGLAAAMDFVESVGLGAIERHEAQVAEYARARLSSIAGVTVIGAPRASGPILSFVLDGLDAHAVGVVLDLEGVAVRTGHHCAQPAIDRWSLDATVRVSLGMYNGKDDIDRLVAALGRARATLS